MAEVTFIKDREWYKRFKRSEFLGSHNNAMFKGVPFIFVDDSFGSGKRIVQHEFPQRDVPYSENLGKRIRKISIQGKLLGDDYLTQKDNLLFVCEEDGPGELVHPYYGVLNVECSTIEITNQKTVTRICEFQAVFFETGELEFPTSIVDTAAATLLQTEATLNTSKSTFLQIYDKTVKLVSAIEGKEQILDDAFRAINIAKDKANMPAEFQRRINRAKEDVSLLVLSAESLFDSVLDTITFGLLGETKDDDIDPRDSFNGLLPMLRFSPEVRNSSDDSDLIKDMLQWNTLANMAYLTSVIDFESTNEALFYKDTILNKIDELVLLDISNELEQDLRDLRKVVIEDIDARSLTLPSLTTYLPGYTLPVLVLSHNLYGNVDEEQDIINRNNLYHFSFTGDGEPAIDNILGIQHPGFTPGGEELEVLLNV